MEVNAALTLLGKNGRWQITYFIILSVGMMFPGCWHTFGYIFQAHTPLHHCSVPNGTDISEIIPWDDDIRNYSSCLVFVNGSFDNRTIRQCGDDVNSWYYYGDVTDTIVSDWNLVCDRSYLKKTTQLVVALGIMVGTAVFTPMSDYFGRRPVFLYLQYIMVVVGVCNAFVYNYYIYLVVRFLTGALRPGFGLAAYILACELFPAKQRTFAGIIIEDFWGVAMCFLALFMYLIPNWRHLQLLVSLFGLVFVPVYWFLPESIPWLVSKGRLEEAERTIQSAARMNRVQGFPASVFVSQAIKPPPDSKPADNTMISNTSSLRRLCGFWSMFRRKKSVTNTTLMDVLRNPRLRYFTFAMGLLWFVNSTVYYGLTLHTGDLAGNRYLNLFISGIVEIPAYTLSYFIINKWGRRVPLLGFHVIAGVFLILSQVIPKETGDGISLHWLHITFTMIGKFGITASYGIVYIYAPELFPTDVRSRAMGVAAISGRIGSMVAPFSTLLNDIEPWLTSVVFGVVSIVGGLVALTLPETNKRPLPQTIDDIEHWYKTSDEQSSKLHAHNDRQGGIEAVALLLKNNNTENQQLTNCHAGAKNNHFVPVDDDGHTAT